jgi:hypothetical protein
MEETFGHDWKKLLDADIFTDPTRLNLLETMSKVSHGGLKKYVKSMAKETELNYLARKMRAAKGPEANKEIADFAKKAGVKMEDVRKRAVDLGELAAPLEKMKQAQKRVGELSEDLNKAAGADLKRVRNGLDDAEKQYLAAREAFYRSSYSKLELEQDVLHQKFLATTGRAEKEAIAEEMAVIQSKLNAANEGAYYGGGATKNAVHRERTLAKRLPGLRLMEPGQLYTVVLGDLDFLEEAIRKTGGKGLNEDTGKALVKYANRLEVSAGQFGIDTASSAKARKLFDDVSALLDAARHEPAGLMGKKIKGYLEEAAEVIKKQRAEIESALPVMEKKWADKIQASIARERYILTVVLIEVGIVGNEIR